MENIDLESVEIWINDINMTSYTNISTNHLILDPPKLLPGRHIVKIYMKNKIFIFCYCYLLFTICYLFFVLCYLLFVMFYLQDAFHKGCITSLTVWFFRCFRYFRFVQVLQVFLVFQALQVFQVCRF